MSSVSASFFSVSESSGEMFYNAGIMEPNDRIHWLYIIMIRHQTQENHASVNGSSDNLSVSDKRKEQNDRPVAKLSLIFSDALLLTEGFR